MILDYQLKVHRDGSVIVSELTGPGLDIGGLTSVRETIWRQIADVNEARTRQLLIEMGWTPPKEPQ